MEGITGNHPKPALSSTDSTALYFVKAYAILVVIAAHISFISYETPLRNVVTRLWDMLSTTGVGSFLIVGGILYIRAPGDSLRFWSRKAKSLILPWIFCFLLTSLYRALRGHIDAPAEYLRAFLGLNSTMYFISMYVFCLGFFKLVGSGTLVLVGCIALSAAALAAAPRCPGGMLRELLTSHVNPVNWIGFFALGILLRKRGLRWHKGWNWAALLTAVAIGIPVFRNNIFTYFHIFNTIFSVSVFFLLFSLGRKIAATSLEQPVRRIGQSTYCIYLLHIVCLAPIPGWIPDSIWKDVFLPVVGLAVMMLLIELGSWITRRLPFGETLRNLVGLR